MFIEIASRSVLPNGGGPMLTTRPLQYLDPSALADRASNEGVVRGSMAAAEALGKGISGAGAAIGGGLQDMGKQKMQKQAYEAARTQQERENAMADRRASQIDAQIKNQSDYYSQKVGGIDEKDIVAYANARGIPFQQAKEEMTGTPKQNNTDIWTRNLTTAPTTSMGGRGPLINLQGR